MFLKALTLRGFKSFADKTVLEFEPGVMVVVGPNGSGKSNLVDAVAWVLGAQGPRTLRGGKMDDVIFAGTPDRPALGRAEVSLTIDNTSGMLPIEFSEVTITRTLFRNGDSEYAINSSPCRLLDIQELLSDTGIGRQQHVIVGQGQLDAVLNSRPEDRRAVIEEAAGVLKYRKRRERAERRLEATEGNLLRLNDLLREVRRGLAPLQKQADAARRHDGLVAELRAIRLHLVGHELAGLQAKTERLRDQGVELSRNEAVIQARLRELDIAVLDAERALTDAGHGDVADALVRVESMRERARGLQALLAEKRRGLERELAAAADEGVVETLVADAGALRSELAGVERDAALLEERRQEVASLDNWVDPEGLSRAEVALTAAERQWRECENDAGKWQARAEALAQALDSVRGAVDRSTLAGIDGIAGDLVDYLEIEPGAEAAVAAALGEAMHALVIESDDAARATVTRLAGGDVQALLLVLNQRDTAVTSGATIAPEGARALASFVRAPLPGLQATLAKLLAGVVLADGDWRSAVDLAIENPDLTVMTRSGDRFGGPGLWRLGGEQVSGITRATLEEAEEQARSARTARAAAEAAVVEARQAVAEGRQQAAAAAGVRKELEMRGATLDERRDVLTRRLAGVEDRLARDPEAKATAERYRSALVAKEGSYREVAERLDVQAGGIDAVLERLRAERRRQAEAASAAGGQLNALRRERSDLERQLTELRERQQRREVDEAENRMRLEAVVEKIRTDFDCEPAVALDAPAPETVEGTTLAGRARDLDRELRIMGPINPLALEEYDALLERHDFLGQQLEDVKNSRRELQRVIKAVDKEIVTVFETAFADVQENFAQLFTTLFPGGSGRIFLTDPDDLLNTGIEMEARPSGKNTRRLSLLSGGERSLTAMAFLFGVFRARPSPFYLLDEVEAALDDVNLHRFLDLVHEFRNEAQLLIVSHQKRTMEAGDCLYGVSMAPGASSRVVSQKMRGEVVLKLSLLAATAAEQAEKAAACGLPGKQAWLCSTVYDLTGSQRAAEIGDDLAKPLHVLLIILVAYLLVRITRVFVRRVVRNLQKDQTGDRISKIRQATGLALLDTSPVPGIRRALRAETIGAVIRSIASVLIWSTALIMVLDEIGVNLAAIGIGASIVGVALGFGAQALVRDFLSGIFMLVEDQYGVGDVIDTGVAIGTVEGVSLRTTRLRDSEGTVWHVPNGEIRRVGNKSQQWSRVLLDIPIAYDADLDRATFVIKDAAEALAAHPDFSSAITDEPEVWGIEQIEADHVLIRLAVKTVPLEQWRVARALRARLKAALDDAGIGPASESVITYRTQGGAAGRDR